MSKKTSLEAFCQNMDRGLADFLYDSKNRQWSHRTDIEWMKVLADYMGFTEDSEAFALDDRESEEESEFLDDESFRIDREQGLTDRTGCARMSVRRDQRQRKKKKKFIYDIFIINEIVALQPNGSAGILKSCKVSDRVRPELPNKEQVRKGKDYRQVN